MDLTSRIGIAVSGCKNGYAVLATENIDGNSPLLRQGLRDQRSYMRVTEPGHDFYTMTIVSETLVLSACRSSVDAVGSSGGYIAVSIFVPVQIQAKGAASLLHSMLENYWSEYMHPMFGSPLRDKFENAFKLRQLLEGAKDSFSLPALRYKVFHSETQKPPLFCEYGSVAEVDAVMANPFHRQYAQGTEVIFIPKGFLDSTPVNHNLENPNYVTAQRTLPLSAQGRLMLPAGAPFALADYKVGGKAYPTPADVSLDTSSNISYTIVLPGGEKKTFNGTLHDAIQRRLIARKGDDYELTPPRIAVRLAVSGVISGISLGLTNGHRDPAEGYRCADGLWEFKIPCSGFPYSLVETKNGRAQRTLARDVVTSDSLIQNPIKVKVTPSVPANPGGFGLKPGKGGLKFSKPMLIAIAAVTLALVGFLVWLFFMRTPDMPEQPETTYTPIQEIPEKETTLTDQNEPKYCYLIIPSETINEAIHGWKIYDLTSAALSGISGTGIYYDQTLRVEVIRIPKQKDLNFKEEDLILAFLQKDSNTRKVIGTIDLSSTNMPDGEYKDFMEFPANKNNKYVIIPDVTLDKAKYQAYKAFDPTDKKFKPLVPFDPMNEDFYDTDDEGKDIHVRTPATAVQPAGKNATGHTAPSKNTRVQTRKNSTQIDKTLY